MLVEDEPLIALDLSDTLTEAGYTIEGPFVTLASAITAAQENRYDAAVLDVALGKQDVWPAAALLFERGIPIIFMSGHSPGGSVPEQFRGSHWLAKPVDLALLKAALESLLRGEEASHPRIKP